MGIASFALNNRDWARCCRQPIVLSGRFQDRANRPWTTYTGSLADRQFPSLRADLGIRASIHIGRMPPGFTAKIMQAVVDAADLDRD